MGPDTISWNTVLASTVFATALSSFVTWFLKSREHNFFYKKHILEKRIAVYNSVEELFKTLHTITETNENLGVIQYHAIFDGTDNSNLNIFKNELQNILDKSFWLSDPILLLIRKLFNIVYIVSQNPLNLNREYMLDEASRNYRQIENCSKEIKEQYLKDLRTLDEVATFKNDKFLT